MPNFDFINPNSDNNSTQFPNDSENSSSAGSVNSHSNNTGCSKGIVNGNKGKINKPLIRIPGTTEKGKSVIRILSLNTRGKVAKSLNFTISLIIITQMSFVLLKLT